MTDTITQYTRKPTVYQYLDGTADLGFGIWLLAWAISSVISRGTLAFLVASAVAWSVVHFGTRCIRRRLVYPRSGYMKPKKHYWTLALALLISLVGSVVLFYWFGKARSGWPSFPLIFGLLTAMVILIRALIDGTPKRVTLAMASIAIGFALQFIEPREAPGNSWYCLLMGTAFLISGALTLRSYVRRMPPRDLESE